MIITTTSIKIIPNAIYTKNAGKIFSSKPIINARIAIIDSPIPIVSFEQQKFNSKLTPSGDIIATVNGTNLYYVHYINKVVSDDYELTEQDKKDQSSGKVVFSYDDSASQIEVSPVHHLFVTVVEIPVSQLMHNML